MLRRDFLAAGAAASLMLGDALPASSQALTPLHIQTIPFDAGSQVFYAKDMGFFTKAGLVAAAGILFD